MCIALPIQDKFNYDLFFGDHIYHFNHVTFLKLLKNCGFEVINFELGRESYFNIGIYVCRKASYINNCKYTFIKNKNLKNCKIILNNIDNIIKYSSENLFAFGNGEIAKTIIPYTKLNDFIIKYIDDYVNECNNISSIESKKIFSRLSNVNLLMLVNPYHSKKVFEIYKKFDNINFLNIFKGIL